MNLMQFRRRAAALSSQQTGGSNGSMIAFAEADGGPTLLNYIITILIRRKWVILGAIASFLLIALVVTLLLPPKYTATSTIEIQRENGSLIDVRGADQSSRAVADQEFYQTQYGLLIARALAERVAASLRLYDNPGFFGMFGASETADAWFDNGRVRPSASTREGRIAAAAAILLKHVEIRPERFSRLVGIRFTSPDPNLSKQIVDAWGSNFIQLTLDRRIEATAYGRHVLEQRLGQLRSRIDESERRLVDYASREGIVNLPTAGSAPGQAGGTVEHSLAADDLVSINTELAEATARRVEAESRLHSRAGEVNEALTNPAIAVMRQRRAELAADYARLMTQFEPQYPPALAIQNQVQQLDRSIAREEARVQNSLRETYEASRTREAALGRDVDRLKANVLDLRRRSIQYNIIQRDADTNRQLYDALLQRYKEIGVAGGVGLNNISVVDVAEVPHSPSSPNLPLNLAIALVVGFAVGTGAALGLEQLHQGINDPSDVEASLGVPLLGTIPNVADGHPLEALEDRKSAVSEAYQSVQTSLSFSTDHGIPRTMAVTSTRAAEGKTTTAYALAQSIARTKGRVLLVDADMRAPSLHHLLDLHNESGLSNYLAGEGDVAALVRPTPHNRLFVMTSGPQPPSAPDLLASERLGELIEKLSKEFSHVVFDAPPVMGLADAPLVGSIVEGMVFVMEANSTQRSMAKVALGRLASSSSQLLGIVLTKFDPRKAHYGYGYDYGYGYGYGDSPAKSS